MKILHIVGARPNFMKIAPLIAEIRRRSSSLSQMLVHTGQHYDEAMSDAFFRDLDLPAPDINLEVGSGTHAETTARVMLAFEPVIVRERPDWTLVVGDVNSTLACALVASKLQFRVGHVEAGLRSFDRRMPEEINRILTDQLSDLLLTPSADADANLLREGIDASRIVRVGNVMIDTLLAHLERAQHSTVLETLGLETSEYVVVTLHRPANVDDASTLAGILDALGRIAGELPVIFPAHPRTQLRMTEFGLNAPEGVKIINPLGYLDFLRLWSASKLVLTDSGGLQEETTSLGLPCLTLRENTERPVTITEGTNRLTGADPEKIVGEALAALDSASLTEKRIPELWDGRAAERIIDALIARA